MPRDKPPNNKGKKIATKREATKNERLRFVAGMLRKGVPVAEVYRVITAKWGVADRTAAKYLRELGAFAQGYLDDENSIESEICAALDRLKGRAQRDDSVGNAADQIILNLMGVRALKPLKKSLDAQKIRIEQSRAELMELRAEQTKVELKKAKSAAKRDTRFSHIFESTIERIREQKAASVKDLLELTCLFLEQEMAKGVNADTRQILGSLRHLTQISLADPSSAGAEHQLFTLPDGMRWDQPPEPDDGDDLVAG
tara:strand:- start:1656 stop:2423 length:768 start_codon:yes stop_codon:yes gene_type:complete